MKKSSTTEFAAFLAAHESVPNGATLAAGTVVDGWRVTAFIGRGGSAEVYRVEKGHTAALKILALPADASEEASEAARRRFRREAEFLSQNAFPFFPKLFAAGETDDGRPFVVMELLEARPLPSRGRAVAAFLLQVCTAVRTLHRRGLVHRDIKPGNVLVRANGEIVLIDLGLLKATAAAPGHTGVSVTLMDGRAVGAGTPHYAAPEQFGGGEVSAQSDIHALGVLIDDCFGGRPPRCWNRIVRRATSSLPTQRYRDVDALMRAIRLRHVPRILFWTGLVAFAALAAWWAGRPGVTPAEVAAQFRDDPASAVGLRQAMDDAEGYDEAERWRALCENVVTNVTQKEIVRVITNKVHCYLNVQRKTNTFNYVSAVMTRTVTNAIPVTLVRLGGQTQAFRRPIALSPDRDWWIVGPGTLDADLTGTDTGRCTRVWLDHCVLLNRTMKAPKDAALRYRFRDRVYLNFIDQDASVGWVLKSHLQDYMEDFNGGFERGIHNALEIGGPPTVKGLNEKRQAEIDEQLRRAEEGPW